MDAQNAVESTSRPSVVPERRSEDIRKAASEIPSSPPIRPIIHPPSTNEEGNSDAETVVLPGKDGFSPSKTKKMINRPERRPCDDLGLVSKSSNGDIRHPPKNRDRARDGSRMPVSRPGTGPISADAASSLVARKKKTLQGRARSMLKENSSGLSSAPGSPPMLPRRVLLEEELPSSDSDSSRPKSPNLMKKRDTSRPSEKVISHKRKASVKAESDDEEASRKIRRQRLPGHIIEPLSTPAKHHKIPRPQPSSHLANSCMRSPSPHHKPHRRSLSTQVSSSNGFSQKKRRVPPQISTTEYQSDDSSSGSPHPRSHKLKSLATPAATDSTISPAKMAPHKKHLDAHGQTLLARACAKGEYELARSRLEDRPADLNTADYAGNTPLQIASLNGHESIVKLLIDSGCNLDCVNNDRDTPLLDAVDNGHLGVVKLLLDAGVNPRKSNVNGEEPFDRVSSDLDNADEIRAAIKIAIDKPNATWRKASEDHEHSPQETHPPERQVRDHRSHGPESPRFSPAALINTSRRGASSRSSKTSNSQLYKPLDDKTLRQAACRGDEETVMRILQVKDNVNDPESLVGAARGGHETVMEYLLAFGTDPDPQPIRHLAEDASTPMLAAIGQSTTKIVKLLLDQADFDPTRKCKGETYFEIARRRQGPVWEDEEAMLKVAYENAKKKKDKSPNRRALVRDRPTRLESKDDDARVHKYKVSSPHQEAAKAKVTSLKPTSPKDKSKSSSQIATDDHSIKRGPGRPRKEVPIICVTGREDTALSHKVLPGKLKRQETDHAVNSSEGEATTLKPRRKLVSGRELKDERERERQRRSSMVSNHSGKDGSSPKDKEESADKPKTEIPSEKYHDRAKALRRDDSMDRLSVSGDGSTKRHRSSVTPPHNTSGDNDGEGPIKRRKLDLEGKEKRQRSTNSSPEDRHRKSSSLRDGTPTSTKSTILRDSDKDIKLKPKKLVRSSQLSDKLVKVKIEDVDMIDAPGFVKPEVDADLKAKKDDEKERRFKAKVEARRRDEEQKRQEDEIKKKEIEALEDLKRVEAQKQDEEKQRIEEERRRREEEHLRQEQEERKRQERKRKEEEERAKHEERKRREEEERKRHEEEERKRRDEEERKRREEEECKRREEERKRREEEERKRREEEERKRREEEERKRCEEEERRRCEEEERKRREKEQRERREEARRREEEERIRREEEVRRRDEEERMRREKEARRRMEEERLRKEQLEREAAEEAARHKEAEERERRRLELEKQRRLAEEAERRRKHEEQERLRVSKLPYLLRWFDSLPQPKTREVALKFPNMYGVRYDTIVPDASGAPEVLRELWVLNTHVAFLLGDKDLSLGMYPSWPRQKASKIAKDTLFKIENRYYAMSAPELRDAAKEIPDYIDTLGGCRMNKIIQDRKDTWDLFSNMDLFFVKVADFMSIVPSCLHLRDIPIRIQYKELPLDEEMANRLKGPMRWKQDPFWANRNYGAHPGGFVYKNGQLLEEFKTGVMTRVSRMPFPERRVPRRGFQAVSPEDPDYDRLCREQGITNGLNNHLSNGTSHPSSMSPHHLSSFTPMTPGPTEPVVGAEVILSHSENAAVTALQLPNGLGNHA